MTKFFAAFTFFIFYSAALCYVIDCSVKIIIFIEKKLRRRAVDRRIIAQAKAADVWDKKPIVLAHRALELKAWQDYKIKREPGETDAHLRRRCMAVADNELASTPSEKKERHDEIDAFVYACANQISDTLDIPLEILYGKSKKDKTEGRKIKSIWVREDGTFKEIYKYPPLNTEKTPREEESTNE